MTATAGVPRKSAVTPLGLVVLGCLVVAVDVRLDTLDLFLDPVGYLAVFVGLRRLRARVGGLPRRPDLVALVGAVAGLGTVWVPPEPPGTAGSLAAASASTSAAGWLLQVEQVVGGALLLTLAWMVWDRARQVGLTSEARWFRLLTVGQRVGVVLVVGLSAVDLTGYRPGVPELVLLLVFVSVAVVAAVVLLVALYRRRRAPWLGGLRPAASA